MAKDCENQYDEILEESGMGHMNESLPTSLRRSIWLVQDEADEETYTADEILDGKPQGIIFDIRHSLYAAYKSGEYKYVCKHCNQPLGLKVRTHEGDFFPYFSHFQNSGFCPLKNQIEIDPIQSARERENIFKTSPLHRQMLGLLKEVLDKSEGFADIEENKIISKPEIKGYRKPALYSKFNGHDVCFDLLVSNPLISLLVSRNAFYKLHKMFYLWLFPSFTTKHQRLCQKDILYMNRRNVFVFDCEKFYDEANKNFCGRNINSSSHLYAYEESIRLNKLMLNCYWQTPEIKEVNGEIHISIKWNGPNLVAFEDLNFDWDNYELYYQDSDQDFYKSYPINIQRQIDEWLKIKKDRWTKIFDSIEKRKILYAQLMAKRERKERLKFYYSLIDAGEADLELYYDEESKLYGFRVDGFDVIPPTYYDAKPFYCGYAWVRKKEKWGLIDYQNNHITKFQYSTIGNLGEGLYSCTKGRIEYILNYNGRLISERGFYSVIRVNQKILKVRGYSEDYGYNRWGYSEKIIVGTRYGIIDNQGNFVTELCYTKIEDFLDGYSKAQKGKLWGIIDEEGTVKLSFEYEDILEVSKNFLIVKKNGYMNPAKIDWDGNEIYNIIDCENVNIYESKFLCKFGLMDKSGKIITPLTYDRIKELGNSRFACFKDGSWSLIDSEGRKLLSDVDDIFNFLNNREYFKFKKNKAWGVVNIMGDVILSNDFYEILDMTNNILTIKKHKNGDIAEINLNGEEIFSYQNFSECVVYRSRLQRKSGLMNHENKAITGLIFDTIKDFKDGKARAKLGSYWGVIDAFGETIIPFEYCELGDFVDGIAPAKIYGWGFVDENGKEVYTYHDLGGLTICESRLLKRFGIMRINQMQIPELIYECMPKFNDGRAIVSKNHHWGIINENEDVIIPFNYEEIIATHGQNYIVKKNRKYGIVNNSGEIIVPIKYDSIFEKEVGLYCVREESYGLWGVINDFNIMIIPIKYDAIGNIKNSIANVKKGKWWKKIVLKQEKSSKEMKSIKLDILEEGVVYNAKATGTMKFGVFIEIQDIGSGLIPAKEIFERNRKLKEFKKGTLIKVVLLKKDFQKNRATFKLSD